MIIYRAHLESRGAKSAGTLSIPRSLIPHQNTQKIDVNCDCPDHISMEIRDPHGPETSWIEGLAQEELSMQESGVINFNQHLSAESLLEESSIDFMEMLKELFEIFVGRFNECRGEQGQYGQIKMFKISGTVNDFMLFRNSLKLVVARKRVDLISIGFISTTTGAFSARLNLATPSQQSAHDISAHIGPFNKISWRFQGEEVDAEILVRHYLTEFVQHSAT